MNNIAVFCGSSKGSRKVYETQAKILGAYLANRDIDIIYGGGNIGLMGAIADAALAKNGKVIGVIPEFLLMKEVGHTGVSELIVVQTMHERKITMFERSDAFMILPGGFGTMEEFFEVLTWQQLGLHEKPIGILNTNGYYDHLIDLFDNMVKEGFLKEANREMVIVDDRLDDLVEKMENYHGQRVDKWLGKDNT